MATSQAEKAPDPNHDPGLNKSANLPGIHAMSDNLQNSRRVMRSLAANDAKVGTQILQRRRTHTSGAQLLDSNDEAM